MQVYLFIKHRVKEIVVVLCVVVIVLLLAKLDDCNNGINGNYPLQGTYASIVDNPADQRYLSLDERGGEFWHLKSSDQLIQEGSLAKGDTYVLYEPDGKTVYGKIVKSYKKFYFIDSDLHVSIYKKLWDVLAVPSKGESAS